MTCGNYKGYVILLIDGDYCVWADEVLHRFPTEPEAMEFIDERIGL